MIGILDSGIGGIAVLNAIVRRDPSVDCCYVADTAFFPYGRKSREEIVGRSRQVVDFLLQRGSTLIVLACNSATGAAIADLRRTLDVPVVGIEPAIKIARRHLKAGPIGVLCTDLTSSGEKYRRLMESQGLRDHVVTYASATLAEVIEEGSLTGKALMDYLESEVEPFRHHRLGCLVLGCTHYAFVRDHLEKILGIPVLEPADAVAQRALSLYLSNGLEGQNGRSSFFTTGSLERVRERAAPLLERQPVWWSDLQLSGRCDVRVALSE